MVSKVALVEIGEDAEQALELIGGIGDVSQLQMLMVREDRAGSEAGFRILIDLLS